MISLLMSFSFWDRMRASSSTVLCVFFCSVLVMQGYAQLESQQETQEIPQTVVSDPLFIEEDTTEAETEENAESNIDEPLEGLEAIQKTLEYGIDSAVAEAIDTVKQLNTDQFSDEILQRMSTSSSDEVRIAGLDYFRYFKSKQAIPYALTVVSRYIEESTRLVQQAIFYLQDFYEELDEQQVRALLDYINGIIESDHVGTILAALELVPFLYSEKDVAYDPKIAMSITEIKVTEEQFDNTIILTEDTTTTVTASPQLYSQTLQKYYDSTTVQAIKAAMLQVLGKIQAYNMIDSLIGIAEDEGATTSLRVAALKALGEFEQYPNKEIEEKIIQLFDTLRSSEQVAIRQAVFVSITNIKEADVYDNIDIETWLLNGVRDNESDVRIATLKAVKHMLDKTPMVIQNLDFFPFMIETDPSTEVQAEALEIYVTLESRDEGKEYLLRQIKNIQSINAKNRAILMLAFEKMDDLDTIDPIVTLSTTLIEKRFSYVLQVLSEIASQYSNDSLVTLALVLVRSDDSQVVYNTLNLIARNRMYSLSSYVKALSRDRTKSGKVRIRAAQVSELLSTP